MMMTGVPFSGTVHCASGSWLSLMENLRVKNSEILDLHRQEI